MKYAAAFLFALVFVSCASAQRGSSYAISVRKMPSVSGDLSLCGDNTITRFDSVTGELQCSTVTVDDSGNIVITGGNINSPSGTGLTIEMLGPQDMTLKNDEIPSSTTGAGIKIMSGGLIEINSKALQFLRTDVLVMNIGFLKNDLIAQIQDAFGANRIVFGDDEDITLIPGSGIVEVIGEVQTLSVAADLTTTTTITTIQKRLSVDTSSNDVEVDLYACGASTDGYEVHIREVESTNDTTVDPDGSENINGSSTPFTFDGASVDKLSIRCKGSGADQGWWDF